MNGEEIGWNKPQRVTIGLPSRQYPTSWTNGCTGTRP